MSSGPQEPSTEPAPLGLCPTESLWPLSLPLSSEATLPIQQSYVLPLEPQAHPGACDPIRACAPRCCRACGSRAWLAGFSEACGSGAHHPAASLRPQGHSVFFFVSASFMSWGAPPWPWLLALSLDQNPVFKVSPQSLSPELKLLPSLGFHNSDVSGPCTCLLTYKPMPLSV